MKLWRFLLLIQCSAFLGLGGCRYLEKPNDKNNQINGSAADSIIRNSPSPILIRQPVVVSAGKSTIVNQAITPFIRKHRGIFSTMPNFNAEQGLALSSVLCSFRDKMGNLWFGTNSGGISRYDGKAFQTFSIANGILNAVIFSLFEDANGKIWIGTNGGIYTYNGTTFSPFILSKAFAGLSVRCITQDKSGVMWFGTDDHGLYNFDGKSVNQVDVTPENPNISINCLLLDMNGVLWIGTDGAGLYKYEKNHLVAIPKSSGLRSSRILCLTEDRNGGIWIGANGRAGKNGGVYMLRNDLAIRIPCLERFNETSVFCILEDHANNLWFGTTNGAFLIPCDISGTSSAEGFLFRKLEGLADDFVLGLTEDLKGNVWISTYSSGVFQFTGKSLTSFSTDQGINGNYVCALTQDKMGRLWYGTQEKGIGYILDTAIYSLPTSTGWSNNVFLCMTEDFQGNLWLGTQTKGLLRITPNPTDENGTFSGKLTQWTTKEGLPSDEIRSIQIDNNGLVWLGTNGGGIVKFDGKTFTHYTEKDGLIQNMVTCSVLSKDGTMWFGTKEAGISHFDGTKFTNYGRKQGLNNTTIWSLNEDENGNILIGTNEGVNILKQLPDGRYQITALTTGQGLSDNAVQSIVKYKNNDIFLGTNKGINVLREGKITEVFSDRTGYAIKDINTNAMFCDDKGIIWGGTGDKLIRFDYSQVSKDTAQPTIVLQSVKVNNEVVAWNDLRLGVKASNGASINEEVMGFGRKLNEAEKKSMLSKCAGVQFTSIRPFYPIPENLVLPYKLNGVSFDFTAIETGRPNLIRYQYFLEGYDNDWSPITEKGTAIFGNIHEGKYTFKVKARSPEGVWSAPVTYSFEVAPPWFRTWYMYGLYVLGFGAIVYVFFQWRTDALRKEKEKLSQLVMERTAEVVQQKDEAEKQKELVIHKNKEITDSINYAQLIQQAMLQQKKGDKALKPEHFILLKPKDIVSGDFYWSLSKQGYWYIAAVDCTGHGVPGAFMSMLGLTNLNEINASEELLSPAEILNRLRGKIMNELHQTGAENENKDGMDMSLAMVNMSTYEVQWAGANNSIYIVSKEGLREIKGDKQPIGYHHLAKPFTNHSFQLNTNESFYLFTDGYADQFGGPKGKKLLYKRFENLLIEHFASPAIWQQELIDTFFVHWKGEQEQVDDVCVIGVILP